MQIKPKERGLTLLEILITISIISILTGGAILSFRGYKERADMMADETNLLILQTAVKVFATDTGAVAGGIAELRQKDYQRAYAMVLEQKQPYTFTVYLDEFWDAFWGISTAEAGSGLGSFIPSKYYNNNLKVLICPRDPSPPTGFDANGRPVGGASYAINGPFRGRPLSFLLNPANAQIPLIFEVDEAGDEQFRHRGGRVSVRATAGGEAIQYNRNEGGLTCSTSRSNWPTGGLSPIGSGMGGS